MQASCQCMLPRNNIENLRGFPPLEIVYATALEVRNHDKHN
jgi:hypothetical protein